MFPEGHQDTMVPGLIVPRMPRSLSVRLIVVGLMLAVFVLGVEVVAHYDGNAHDEAHCTCQVCHIAHAAIPQPATQTQIQIPVHIARIAPPENSSPVVESASILSIPRAPPA